MHPVSYNTWFENYKLDGEKTIKDSWDRAAVEAAAVEKPDIRKKIVKEFRWMLDDFKVVLGGRILANIGGDHKSTTLFNCYAHNPADIGVHDIDSIENIYNMVKSQAHTLKSEGGYGTNFSYIRPRGAYIEGIGGRTPGVLKFMELWDVSATIITAGDATNKKKKGEKIKIRKGAQMGVLSIWHPEILDFIEAKKQPGVLTKFNLSVGVDDYFMQALENGDNWCLKFPETSYEKYEDEWDGDIYKWEEKGYPVNVYKTIKARDLWDKIMYATFTRNEPGVLFLGLANKFNPLSYAEDIKQSNPCFVGATKILTPDGYKEIGTLAGKEVELINFNGEKSTGTVWSNGVKDTIRLKFSDNNFPDIACTKDHKFETIGGEIVEAKDLKGKKIKPFIGFKLSNLNQDIIKSEYEDMPKWIYDEGISKKDVVSILCSFLSHNKAVAIASEKPYGCISYFSDIRKRLQDVQFLLKHHFNISSVITNDYSEKHYFLTIKDSYSILNFANYIGFTDAKRRDNLKRLAYIKTPKVESINPNGAVEVFDFSEPKTHWGVIEGFKAHNCGEILMSTGVCNLASLNLPKFYTDGEFDFETFKRAVTIAVRFLDNVNDISTTPLPEYTNAVNEKRRIGLGTMGLGSLLYMMGLRYGSDEAIKVVDEIYRVKTETELITSALLGAEKGNFLLFDKEKYFNTWYWKTLPIKKETKQLIEEIGCMRNSHRAMNAPTGNTGILAGIVSGGIEPVFMKEYARWITVNKHEQMNLKKIGFEFPDIDKNEWFETDWLKFDKRGDEEILKGSFQGVDYEVDKSRGLVKYVELEDYGWAFVKKNKLNFDENVFATTEDLNVDEHINMLAAISKYVDQNNSKTINIPADYPFESFKNIYYYAWKNNIKGLTTYRAGTMTAVIEQKKKISEYQSELDEVFEKANGDVIQDGIKLPDQYYSKGYIIRDKNKKKWYIHIAFADSKYKKPFAIFVSTNDRESSEVADEIINSMETLVIEKGVSRKLVDIQSAKYKGQSNVVKIARAIGMALRHNIKILDIVKVLDLYDIEFSSFVFHLKKLLQKFIQNGTVVRGEKCPVCKKRNTIIYSEGCKSCKNCGWSAC